MMTQKEKKRHQHPAARQPPTIEAKTKAKVKREVSDESFPNKVQKKSQNSKTSKACTPLTTNNNDKPLALKANPFATL